MAKAIFPQGNETQQNLASYYFHTMLFIFKNSSKYDLI